MSGEKQLKGKHLISEASEITGLSKQTIRFYEKKGLIPPIKRNTNGYRIFGNDDIRKLMLIKKAKNLHLPLDEIEQIVDLAFNENCHSFELKFLHLLKEKKVQVEKKLKALYKLRTDLINTQNYVLENREHFSSYCNARDCRNCAFIDE